MLPTLSAVSFVVFLGLLAENGCISAAGCPSIVARQSWGARPPAYEQRPLSRPIQRVFIHDITWKRCHTSISCSEALRGIQDSYQHRQVQGLSDNQKYSDIVFNFVVGGDGHIYEGRGWDKRGLHAGNYSDSLSIGFIGAYSSVVPPQRMRTAAQDLINCGLATGKIAKSYTLHAHRDATNSNCPGPLFYTEISRWWANYGGVLPGGRH